MKTLSSRSTSTTTTGEPNSLAEAIGSFNPLWDSKDDPGRLLLARRGGRAANFGQ